MSRLRVAVIGTFYRRYENTVPLVTRLAAESTRRPDEAWLVGETSTDAKHLRAAAALHEHSWLKVKRLPTPKVGDAYTVIPYSHKINWALDKTRADLIVYLDNGSIPHPAKIQIMAEALEDNPDWGAVYCTQHRTGYQDVIHRADQVMVNGDGQVNYTQVMHRKTADRWPLDMALANPDVADGKFWARLHQSLGPFHPVAGHIVLDEHHMPDVHAQGL